MEKFNPDEINKPGWKPKFLSEYSMGEYDFKRINDTLVSVDFSCAEVNSTDTPSLVMMQNYFARLKNLYDNFRPLMAYANVIEELDQIIEMAKGYKRNWERQSKVGMPMNQARIQKFVDLLNALKTRLYFYKQVIGLGIKVHRNLTTAEKIKKGVHGDKNFEDLPEA